MAATVVNTSIKTANWSKKKPADYSGKDLDNALKAYETLVEKDVSIPADLPTMPKQAVKDFENCIKEMQTAVTDFQKAVTHLKQLIAALQKVSAAGEKTAGELEKLAKDKTGAEAKAYSEAATVASGIAAQASEVARKMQ
jgi:hypothetical protein